MINPSRINGNIELPFTRKEIVEAGFQTSGQHHALECVEKGHKSPLRQPLLQYLRAAGARVAIRVSLEGAVRWALGVGFASL
jgi:hypothetical protein